MISTGTWCISLNPFNQSLLTTEELQLDCLCYLQYQGKPVKASRLFAGNEHEEQVKRIADHFNIDASFYQGMEYDTLVMKTLSAKSNYDRITDKAAIIFTSLFGTKELNNFASEKEAYHQLMHDIITQQQFSTGLILNKEVKRIFVDGGFSKNIIYMNLLAKAFPHLEVFATSMPQASALGCALAIHQSWDTKPIPSDLIKLQYQPITK